MLQSSIFLLDYQLLLRSGPANILVTHEAPTAHPRGWQAIDESADTLGVQLVVHGHHHQNIDYLAEGLMSAAAPFHAFGADMGSYLGWPRVHAEGSESEDLPQDLLNLAAQVFGAALRTRLNKSHKLLDGRTPAAFAAGGGSQKVRLLLNAIHPAW